VIARAAGLCAFALALSFAVSPLAVRAAENPPPSGDAILARAKARFRGYQRPPFVTYTLAREDGIGGRPYLADSYTLRVWCRTADRAALTRTVNDGGVADGPLAFLRPAFDQAVDPGPPTIDIFERNAFVSAAAVAAPATSEIPTLAVVAVRVELDYRVEGVALEGRTYLLRLSPRRDPERNRLRRLWVDHDSFDLKRALATDALFMGDDRSAELFDMKFEMQDGIPVIRSIEMRSADVPAVLPQVLRHRGVYYFQNIAFADALPEWYFDPTQYGPHFREAPR
jgi:hypothetical protein